MRAVRILKISAAVAAAIPIAFLLLFAVGEGAGGSGHYVQAAPLIVLAILAWYYPRVGGYALIASAIIVGALFAFYSRSQDIFTTAVVELILFFPILLSGIFFMRASAYAAHP